MNLKRYTKGKVFNVKEVEKIKNCMTGDFSFYEGKDEKGKAVYSRWKINFVGEAYEEAKLLKNTDNIFLIDSKVDKLYNEDVGEMYIFITCYKFQKMKKQLTENSEKAEKL